MSEDKSISVVNLGKLSKPADTLIKKISNAIGGIFAPSQITRIAKAEAEAALIKAQSEIQIAELQLQNSAVQRFLKEETIHQKNIEIGEVLLTKMGKELASICDVKPVDGFLDYVKAKWINHSPTKTIKHLGVLINKR